jgi:anti-sigma B factor antagonist
MPYERLTIESREGARPGERLIVLEGVLNFETAPEFHDAVRGGEPATLVVDMTRLRSVDSSGLGVLIGAYASCERTCRRLLLAGVNERIWDLFRMCHIEDVFHRYPTVADAEASITAAEPAEELVPEPLA